MTLSTRQEGREEIKGGGREGRKERKEDKGERRKEGR